MTTDDREKTRAARTLRKMYLTRCRERIKKQTRPAHYDNDPVNNCMFNIQSYTAVHEDGATTNINQPGNTSSTNIGGLSFQPQLLDNITDSSRMQTARPRRTTDAREKAREARELRKMYLNRRRDQRKKQTCPAQNDNDPVNNQMFNIHSYTTVHEDGTTTNITRSGYTSSTNIVELTGQTQLLDNIIESPRLHTPRLQRAAIERRNLARGLQTRNREDIRRRHRSTLSHTEFDEGVHFEEAINTNEDEDQALSTNQGIAEHSVCQESTQEGIGGSDRPTPRKFVEIWDFGAPTQICSNCGAILWYQERNRLSRTPTNPKYTICCREGKVQLPYLQETPQFLKDILDLELGGTRARKFRENIRLYNSMFAFTSMGANVDKSINNGRGPYVFRINGQNHHKIGSLLPPDGQTPKFAQLYVYDTDNEISNRLNAFRSNCDRRSLDPEIVDGLMKMLDSHNELSKAFRMARDRFHSSDHIQLRLKLIGTRQKDARQYNLPTSSEIAGLIVGNGHESGTRDIIVEEKGHGLRRITEIHPSFMAMQYPLLFPYGEDGFRTGILYSDVRRSKPTKRNTVSIREYYAFRIQHRFIEGKTLVRGGRLYQQFLVDAYSCIEESRLSWVRSNQPRLRTELYNGLRDAVVAGDTNAVSVGKRLVLPSSFTGGPRYMVQNYQDAIAICRWAGPPDIFITFTCNPKWKEIQAFLDLMPGQKVEDTSDIVTRVFHIKLNELMKDLRQGQHFGKVKAATYTIEFQKRGLPHAHILIFLEDTDKPSSPLDIDRIISAELPDKEKDPLAFDTVVQFMLHGPCGITLNPQSPCMVNNTCTKFYPRPWSMHTTIDDATGFPIYRRRKDSRIALKNGTPLDNRWVVPHNIDLIVKYQAHINVEFCNQAMSVKYLFKYINKGSDRATIVIEDNTTSGESMTVHPVREVDEIKKYLDCRYLSASEACWRIFEFDIHYRDPAVERLSYHLPGAQPVTFRDTDNLAEVVDRDDLEHTQFLQWMHINTLYPDARDLTYVDFPRHWTWYKDEKIWKRRQRGNTIGRIYYTGEKFYLRMLLNIVKGPQKYEDIRTVEGVVYPDFKSACSALGLLDDDNEWQDAIQEASHWASGTSLRQLFVTLLLFCEITDPLELWNRKWELLSDDILRRQRRILHDENLQLNEEQIKNYTLLEIEKLMNKNNRSLREFPSLPFPNMSFEVGLLNRLIREELSYDRHMLEREFFTMHDGLNVEQRKVYDVVINAIETNSGGIFFVYGSGGTGKTYLWNTIISKVRSQGKIVLAVASSGIAALLLPGGRTAHSRFKIPIDADENASCNIKKQSHLAELIRNTDLIVWDEAPMTNRNSFEAVERTFRDLLQVNVYDSDQQVFGGKTMLLGGDFRQTLPVMERGTRETIVSASLNRSNLWDHCKVFKLNVNMRLRSNDLETMRESISSFSEWVLNLGDGKLPAISINEGEDPSWIKIPNDIRIPVQENPIQQMVASIYQELSTKFSEPAYLRDKCILAPTNECVEEVNSHIISTLPGDVQTYLSSDSISPISEAIENQDILFPTEFLNTLQFSGLPNHKLQIKVGVPIILMRNLNQSAGLCNGTRLIVVQLAKRVIEAEIITGSNIGHRVFIPRIIMSSSNTQWPFILRRRQFPIKLCFAMTINKSQGQTLQNVGIYLPRPVFSHGQLYVAVSRVTSRNGLKILIKNKENEPEGYTQNIVYREIFNNLP